MLCSLWPLWDFCGMPPGPSKFSLMGTCSTLAFTATDGNVGSREGLCSKACQAVWLYFFTKSQQLSSAGHTLDTFLVWTLTFSTWFLWRTPSLRTGWHSALVLLEMQTCKCFFSYSVASLWIWAEFCYSLTVRLGTHFQGPQFPPSLRCESFSAPGYQQSAILPQ
jgi:hypothetical protein